MKLIKTELPESRGRRVLAVSLVFLWCVLIVFAKHVITQLRTDEFYMLGAAVGVFGLAWFFAAGYSGLKPAKDRNHFRRRWCAVALAVTALTLLSDAKEPGFDSDAAAVRAFGLSVIASLVALLIFAGFRARYWWPRSREFRLWAVAGFFWALGIALFVWLQHFGNWDVDSDVVEERLAFMIAMMFIPPTFFGSAWLCLRRLVR